MPIKLTEADVGRRVVYIPPRGEAEAGVITSINTYGHPFVRYDGDQGSKLTHPSDLRWEGHDAD